MIVIKRLIGVFVVILGILLMVMPFFIIFILFGIDRANIAMSTIMEYPLNLISGDDKFGSCLLDMYKEMI